MEEKASVERELKGESGSLTQMGKTQVQFLRLGTLGSPIEFKHVVALTNKTQTMLYFPRIFKFKVFEFNLKPNVVDLKNCT